MIDINLKGIVHVHLSDFADHLDFDFGRRIADVGAQPQLGLWPKRWHWFGGGYFDHSTFARQNLRLMCGRWFAEMDWPLNESDAGHAVLSSKRPAPRGERFD